MDQLTDIANRMEIIQFVDNMNTDKAVKSAVESVVDDIMKRAEIDPAFCKQLNDIIGEN